MVRISFECLIPTRYIVNEQEETKVQRIDFRRPFIILEKIDGSMISPYIAGGSVRYIRKKQETCPHIQVWDEKWNLYRCCKSCRRVHRSTKQYNEIQRI